MERKRLPIKDQIAIIEEVMNGKRSISEVCGEHGVSQAAYFKWRKKYLNHEYDDYIKTVLRTDEVRPSGVGAAVHALLDQHANLQLQDLKKEVEKLKEIIVDQTIEISELKKKLSARG